MNLRVCAKCERTLQESDGVKAGHSWYHVGCAANTWIWPHAPELRKVVSSSLKVKEKR